MFEAGNGTDAQLELTDEQLERSSVLSPMLDLMHGKEIVVSSKGPVDHRLPAVLRALQKYACSSALTLLRILIRNEALSGSFGLNLFKAATYLNDISTCNRLFENGSTWGLGKLDEPQENKERLDDCRRGAKSCMDPTNWSRQLFQQIPIDYIRALLRGIDTGRKGKSMDWKIAADEFKRLLEVCTHVR